MKGELQTVEDMDFDFQESDLYYEFGNQMEHDENDDQQDIESYLRDHYPTMTME